MQLVLIKFRDITQTSDWTTHDEVECIVVEAVGWLVEDSAFTVKIATSRSEGEYSAVCAIPRGCIVETTVLQSDPKEQQNDLRPVRNASP